MNFAFFMPFASAFSSALLTEASTTSTAVTDFASLAAHKLIVPMPESVSYTHLTLPTTPYV